VRIVASLWGIQLSLSSSLSGIHFTGLASGLDTDSIIQKLLAFEQRPISRLATQQVQLQNKLGLYQQFQGRMASLKAAGESLNKASAYNVTKSTSTDETKVTITGGSDSLPGSYTIGVSKLAQSHKVSTGAQSSATEALGVSGSILVNGKIIQVAAADTLSQIASRINGSSAGVVASVVNGGADNVFLTLTSEGSGKDGAIHISEIGSGTVLSSLGLYGSSTAIRETTTNGALSENYKDANTAIGDLLGGTLGSGTIQIDGIDVAIDLATDSLSSIAQKINQAAISGVSASIVTAKDANGVTTYQLEVVGDSATPTFTDSGHVLENLGVLQATPSNEILAAQDAEFTLDGVSLTSSTNNVTDVITGATITLKDKTTTDLTLNLTRDLDAIRGTVKTFVDAYNSIREFVKQTSAFDAETFESGPLFGDYNVISNLDLVTAKMTGIVEGLDGQLNSLGLVGVSLGEDGKLTIDDSKLNSALASNLDGVKKLLSEVGGASNANVQFLSATSKTKTTGSGYAVAITQAATKGTTTSGAAQTAASTGAETLTFNGPLFSNNAVTILIAQGNTVDDTVNQINANAQLNGSIEASKDGDGKLVLTSKSYGSSRSFTVVSDLAAAADNSGIGTTVLNADGLDVAGTINGETATGKGQILTGDTDNTTTEGLSLLITATAPGSYGSVTFTRGLGSLLANVIDSLTDPNTGAVTEQNKQLQTQIDSLTDDIKRIQDSVVQKEADLRAQFGRLEQLMAKMQQQQSRLSALLS